MSNAGDRSTQTTRVHSTLRVVVRGFPLPEGAKCVVNEYELLIIARAKAGDWPEVPIERGDLEAVIWTKPDEADRVADALLTDKRVISVRMDAAPLEVG